MLENFEKYTTLQFVSHCFFQGFALYYIFKMEKRTARVSEAQWAILIEYLERNPNLVKARGYNNSAKGRQESARQWREIAEQLNAEGLGTTKTPKDWSVYVSNYKSKLKKIVADINADLAATGGGPPHSTSDLSNMDARFLAVMGPGFGQAVPNVRVNPFADDSPQPSTSAPHVTEEFFIQETLEHDGSHVSHERSRSRSPMVQQPILEVFVEEEVVLPAGTAGPRIPTQTRQPRYRARPLAPIDEARRILSQVELQRAAADTEQARAMHLIGENLGRLATAFENFVANIHRS